MLPSIWRASDAERELARSDPPPPYDGAEYEFHSPPEGLNGDGAAGAAEEAGIKAQLNDLKL